MFSVSYKKGVVLRNNIPYKENECLVSTSIYRETFDIHKRKRSNYYNTL